MFKKQIFSVVMLMQAKTLREPLDSHSQKGQVILETTVGCLSSTVCEDESRSHAPVEPPLAARCTFGQLPWHEP